MYPVADADFETPTYREFAEGFCLTREGMEWFWDHYLPDGDRFHPDASPLRAADHAGAAPALVITAEYDVLRDEGEAYARSARAGGSSGDAQPVRRMIHGFIRMPARIDRANDALAESADALRGAFAAV